jgi:hypothetical protein
VVVAIAAMTAATTKTPISPNSPERLNPPMAAQATPKPTGLKRDI